MSQTFKAYCVNIAVAAHYFYCNSHHHHHFHYRCKMHLYCLKIFLTIPLCNTILYMFPLNSVFFLPAHIFLKLNPSFSFFMLKTCCDHQTYFRYSIYTYVYIDSYFHCLHFLICFYLLIIIYTYLSIIYLNLQYMFLLYYYMNWIKLIKYGQYLNCNEIF